MSGRGGTGVVLASYGRGALVQSGSETLSCALRGRKQRVVCGDRVHWVSGESDGGPAIDALEPRRNLLERIDADAVLLSQFRGRERGNSAGVVATTREFPRPRANSTPTANR